MSFFDPPPKPDLAGKRLLFCQEYLVDLNGAAAARRAGYAERSAARTARELLALPVIKAKVAALKASRAERVGLTADTVLRELTAILVSRYDDYEADPRTGQLRVKEGVSPDARGAIAAVKRTRRVKADGEVVEVLEYKLWDKPAALRLAGQHLGLYEERHRHIVDEETGVLMVPTPVSAAEWCRSAAKQMDGLPGR